ncbi:hypothetical protein FFF34_007845 [Inquilinus sp. KBS0705]|nr:hypothetical protein FFF34_007845 [Inquilinus sp. KBS0705]
MRHILLFCFYIFTTHMTFASRAYYVNNNGDDTQPGTRNKPFKTIQKLNSIKLQPGSKVYLAGNQVFTGPLILTADESSTTSKPITITSYGGGKATIDGGKGQAILVNSNYTILSHLNAKGAGRNDGNTTDGILLANTQGCTIEDVTIDGFQKAGLEVNNCTDVKVLKATARNNGSAGISISGTHETSKNIVIKDCLADNNPGDPTNLTNHSGNGILVGGSDSVLIDHCVATNNGWDMPRLGNGPVGIWGYESSHLTIQYCISYNNKTHAGASDGGGFDFDGGVTNSVIQYCLSYNNEGSGYGLFQYEGASHWANNTMRYCISVNDGTKTTGAAGILVWSSTVDSVDLHSCMIYNNLIINQQAPAVSFHQLSKNEGFLFANNIIMAKDSLVNGPSSGERFLGNIWWGIDGGIPKFREFDNLADWSAATGQETLKDKLVGLQADPLLRGPLTTTLTDPYQLDTLSAYQLQDSSPAIDRGLNLKALFDVILPDQDFFGKPNNTKPYPGIAGH